MSPRRYPQISARRLIQALRRSFGYEIVRQRGSHIRIQTMERDRHPVTVPDHASLRIGTLAEIVKDAAQHFEISEEEVLQRVRPRRRGVN